MYSETENIVCTFSHNWKKVIDEIVSTELVISSSLHGIILAEAYGIPAVMLSGTPSSDITKYKDWYYATGRTNSPIVKSVEEGLKIKYELLPFNVIEEMQEQLIDTFPCDLWGG